MGALGRASRPGDSCDSQSGARSCQRGRRLAPVVRRRAAAASRTSCRMKPDGSKTVYDGKLIDVVVERWGDHEREIVDHPGAVAIVAVDSEGMLTLVRQRREAVREELLELPAGTLEAGEAPLDCARRELAEETGLTGGSWREAATFYTTPGFCRERMHHVIIETGAGGGSSFTDAAYEAAGARIASVEDVWADADLLLKVKEPIEPEYGRLREGLVLFTYLHIAADEPLTRALIDSGITAVAYETVETDSGALPLLAPMSEIAGRLAAQAGAYFLEKPLGGRGLLLGGVPGVAPGKVVIVGGGMVGYNAAVIALGLGANVTILERSVDRMRYLDDILSGRVSLVMSSSLQIAESIKDADVVIGAVLIPGARAPKLITRDMLRDMKEGSVFCDVAIDQGGCAETSHATTHSEPVYEVEGVTHYCVANMPGAVPITATKALTNATLPFVEAVADHGLREAVAQDPSLARGVNVVDGKVTYEAVADAHGLEYQPLEDVLPLSAV